MKNLVHRSGEAARKQESHSIVSFDNGKLLFSKKKKKFLCKCADREQEQLRLSVPLKGKHYLCSKCFTRQTRCSLKGGYLGVHFESKALGPQPGSPALNSTKITLQQSSSN